MTEKKDTVYFIHNVKLWPPKRAVPSSENASGLYIPVIKPDHELLLLKKADSGGLLRLTHPRTGEKVLVPVQPCEMNGESVTPVDDLTDGELKTLQDTLSNQEVNNEAMNQTKADAMCQQDEVLRSFMIKGQPKKDNHLTGKPVMMLPSSHLLTFSNLNFTSMNATIARINKKQLDIAQNVVGLRIRADQPGLASIGPLIKPVPAETTSLKDQKPPAVLETLEQFAARFRRKRIELGFTQGEVGEAIETMYNVILSQTTLSRFEALSLSLRNMQGMMPMLQRWLDDVTKTASGQIEPESQKVSDLGTKNDVLPVCILDSDEETSADNPEIVFRTCTIRGSGRDYPLRVKFSVRRDELISAKRKRKRTMLDSEARVVLESVFERTQMPTLEEFNNLAMDLSQPVQVIKAWFANRRARHRRAINQERIKNSRMKSILNLDATELVVVPEVRQS